MSLFEAYHRDDLAEARQIDDQLCGNLCRCTGYRPIRDAAFDCLKQRRENLPERDKSLLQGSADILPVAYRSTSEVFLRPATLLELFELIERHPEAQLAAGATELGLGITKRFESFPTLIALDAIPELTRVQSTDSEWRIGAAVTLTKLWDAIGDEFPAMSSMLRWFGSRQIRNRATLGGNLATASPIGDSAPVLLTLDAQLSLISAKGIRTVPVNQFFIGYRKTALQPGEIIQEIIIPRVAGGDLSREFARFYKVSRRREMDISTASGCFRVSVDSNGRVGFARIAYGGVAPSPVQAERMEAVLVGRPWNEETVASAAEVVAGLFKPITDVRGSAGYRSSLITELWYRFFEDTQSAPLPERARPNTTSVSIGAPFHESARKHVSGQARYAEDVESDRNYLVAWPICSPHAHAKILRRSKGRAGATRGVELVLFAEDVPGLNDIGSVRHDEPLLASDTISYHGQLVGLIVGGTEAACRAAAGAVEIEYEILPPILHVKEAIAANAFHTESNFIRRGDVHRGFETASHLVEGEFWLGGQEHFYLETQAATAVPGEDSMFITSSTQHPSEVQHVVAHLLGVPAHQVIVESPRMGGGFGGKETQAAINAGLAAVAAHHTGRSVKVRWNRDQDMMITGKRHPFYARFKAGFEPDGLIAALQVELVSDGGWSLDLSTAVTDRALFHLDNAYYFPNVEFSGRVARTNVASNTAFRGFGGPQGMLVVEEILDRVARTLGLRPEVVRERNLYRGRGETNTTPYGQEIENNRVQTVWHRLLETSDFRNRLNEISAWNAQQRTYKRGLAITPVKFGISFTATRFNQAGALVLIYQDGSVQVNHGGTEMGQGLYTNTQAIAARELGLTLDRVRVMPTRTDKVPNTSATAASSGTDLNGAAVRNACRELIGRLKPVAAERLTQKFGGTVGVEDVRFADNYVFPVNMPSRRLGFFEIAGAAYFQRISLSATGFYRTPGIHFNRITGRGKPFHYFAVGAAVSEVEIDGRTGMMRLLRVDILHDVGNSINPAVNRGQVEGGFVQGLGWLTVEELVWDQAGRLLTHSPDTYKIPAIGDVPLDFRVEFLSEATQANNIYGSKAVGEPPLMLAISVREAIREAVAAFGRGGGTVALGSPATCEAIYWAIQERKRAGTP